MTGMVHRVEPDDNIHANSPIIQFVAYKARLIVEYANVSVREKNDGKVVGQRA
jgi:hypothetical protein